MSLESPPVSPAFAGLRVVDLSENISGPFCTKILAAMGAQVVKVERPGDGDPARTAGPFPDDVPHPEKGGLHLYLNMGKKSITLDLASPRGRDLLWRLVEVSDVLVEGFAPGTMERWGSPYSSLREVNPQLIMASVTNFGQTGPYKGYKATEIVLRALSGELHLQGMQDKPPLMKGSHLAQYQGGLHALISVMAALYTRGRLGHGQHIDVSMTEGWASVAGGSFKGYTYKKQVPKRGSGHTAQLPGGLRRCKDGWVVLGARGGRREWWPSFVNMIDLPVLREERFSTEEGRSAHMEELETIYTQWLSRHTREEVYNKAQTSRLAAAYVADAEDLLNSPQLRSRDYYQQVDHPLTPGYPYPSRPFKMQKAAWHNQRAPLLGEHNEEVYRDLLKLTHGELDALKRDGVV